MILSHIDIYQVLILDVNPELRKYKKNVYLLIL